MGQDPLDNQCSTLKFSGKKKNTVRGDKRVCTIITYKKLDRVPAIEIPNLRSECDNQAFYPHIKKII